MNRELENENEYELENEFEQENEFESELENENESELENEFEFENEQEFEVGEQENEQFLGPLISGAASLLGGLGENEAEAESEFEFEAESEFENEFESEFESGEQFFGGLKKLVRRAAPFLKRIAKIAAPIAGKAVGGFLGGPAGAMLGSKLASLAARQLRELEQEMEGAFEQEYEFEQEQELGEHELEQGLGEHEATAELMAHYAAESASELESEAMIGSAVTVTLSRRDRAALRRLVPNLVRGAAILGRVLRMRRATRPMVRVIPTIVSRAVKSLKSAAAQGKPITRQTAARAIARQTRRVLGSPRFCGSVLKRNAKVVRRIVQPASVRASGRRRGSI